MSKRAEQKAEEYENSLDYYHYTNDNPSVAYKEGYEQAEKDLAMTWEDIAEIDALILDTNNEFAVDYSKEVSRQQFYEEVLRKFNKRKK